MRLGIFLGFVGTSLIKSVTPAQTAAKVTRTAQGVWVLSGAHQFDGLLVLRTPTPTPYSALFGGVSI